MTYFLKFADEAEAAAKLDACGYVLDGGYSLGFVLENGTPCDAITPNAIRWDLDVLGMDPQEDGVVHPGFHVNLLVATPLPATLASYAVTPVTPLRTFGGGT